MRLAIIILSLAAITVCLVHIRRAENDASRDIQQLQLRRISLRRAMWDQDCRISSLVSRRKLRERAEKISSGRLVPAGEAPRMFVKADGSEPAGIERNP